MRRFFSSYRRRKRTAWLAAFALIAGSIAAIAVLWPNTGKEKETFSGGKVIVVKPEPKATPLRRGDRRAADKVVAHFVRTAVLRRHLDEAWSISSSEMRQGMSHGEWMRGDIPVVPFPASSFAVASSRLKYSHGNKARYDVVVFAKKGSPVVSTLFSIELHASGAGGARHWLVDYWAPVGGGLGTAPPQSSGGGGPPLPESRPLAVTWMLVPVGILSLIVFIPLLVALRSWYRNRRDKRMYETRPLTPTERS